MLQGERLKVVDRLVWGMTLGGSRRGRSEPTPTGDGSPRKRPAHLRSPWKRVPTLASHCRRPVFRCKPLPRRRTLRDDPNGAAKSLPHRSCGPRKMRKPGKLRQAVRIGACFPVGEDDSTSNARSVGPVAKPPSPASTSCSVSVWSRGGRAEVALDVSKPPAVGETASSLQALPPSLRKGNGTAASAWDAPQASTEPTSSSTQ